VGRKHTHPPRSAAFIASTQINVVSTHEGSESGQRTTEQNPGKDKERKAAWGLLVFFVSFLLFIATTARLLRLSRKSPFRPRFFSSSSLLLSPVFLVFSLSTPS
jgi:hypothetical protein